MEKETLDKYIKAGRIAAEVRAEAEKILRPGLKILELAEMMEKCIRERGGEPAFPVNISINDSVAHYTPVYNDKTEINPGDLVKIDIGVHVDGYIGDMAFTYCSERNSLAEANEKILEAAIKIIKPGVTVGEISSAIESSAKELGVGLIVNLTGHTLQRFVFHGSPSIPNIKTDSKYSFAEGSVIALEPFACKTNGYVRESSLTEIYRLVQDRPARLAEARRIMQLAAVEYHQLPFAKRWLYKEISPVKVSLAIRQLEAAGALESYPVLKEIEGRPVSQAEHTIIVLEKPLVTTRIVE
jgi:methionyl aminopeptidase